MEVVGLRENVQAIRAAHPDAGQRDVLRLLESEYSWKAATTGQEQQVWRLLNELKSENENAYVGRMVAADSPVSEKNILPTRLRPRKAGGALQPVSLNAETEEADAAEDDDDDDDDDFTPDADEEDDDDADDDGAAGDDDQQEADAIDAPLPPLADGELSLVVTGKKLVPQPPPAAPALSQEDEANIREAYERGVISDGAAALTDGERDELNQLADAAETAVVPAPWAAPANVRGVDDFPETGCFGGLHRAVVWLLESVGSRTRA